MSKLENSPAGAPDGSQAQSSLSGRSLSPEAQRALAEAAERRKAAEQAARDAPKEIDGRGGLDPVRYGDWEIKGLTSDF